MIEVIQNITDRFSRTLNDFKHGGAQLDGDGIKSWLNQLTTGEGMLNMGINLFLVAAILVLIIGVIKEKKETKRLRVLQGVSKRREKGRNRLFDVPLFYRLYQSLQHRARQKGDLEKADKQFNIIIWIFAIMAIGFIFLEQYILAFLVPLILSKQLVDILVSMEVDDIELIHQQLPAAIDNVLKAASRYGDTSSIFYEASLTMPHPLKAEFEAMVRKMNSRETIEVLNEFKDKYNDIWVRSFVFIMVSMSDDAEREIALENLKKLQSMLVNENSMKLTAVTNKKVSINTNYTLAGTAAVLGLGATLISETAREFYFSTPLGLLSFLGGYALVFATVKLNIKMSQIKNQ